MATEQELKDLRRGDQVNDTEDKKMYVLGEPITIKNNVIIIVTDEGRAKTFDLAELSHLEAQKNS